MAPRESSSIEMELIGLGDDDGAAQVSAWAALYSKVEFRDRGGCGTTRGDGDCLDWGARTGGVGCKCRANLV